MTVAQWIPPAFTFVPLRQQQRKRASVAGRIKTPEQRQAFWDQKLAGYDLSMDRALHRGRQVYGHEYRDGDASIWNVDDREAAYRRGKLRRPEAETPTKLGYRVVPLDSPHRQGKPFRASFAQWLRENPPAKDPPTNSRELAPSLRNSVSSKDNGIR